MQFEKFDNKAKEAADHHHPTYDEQAWAKMEKLLNKHMPEEKDDRKRFIFFWFLLLGLGAAGLFILKPWKGKKTIAATEQSVKLEMSTASKITEETNSKNSNGEKDTKKIPSSIVSPITGENGVVITGPVVSKQQSSNSVHNIVAKNKNGNIPIANSIVPGGNINDNLQQAGSTIFTEPGNTTTESIAVNVLNPVSNPSIKEKEVIVPIATDKTFITSTDKKTDKENLKNTEGKSKISPVEKSKERITKNKAKKANSFFFNFSAGPDISFVGNNKLGTTKFITGVGLGYTFHDKLTIRTGFYSGRKVYSALPDAYHPPAAFYAYYPYLEKVDADCKVYEIPLSVSYNWGHHNKHNWFASAGVSSYLMKKETYNYFYKYYPASPTQHSQWTINDENKHFLSGLTLSAGYQHSIGKNVSVTIEPYFKLPLSGIGYGKVKLNSSGVLFSVGIKPFK